MITFKINKHLKVQKYLVRGIKIFVKYKDKWICIKLNECELELLEFIINSICDNV